MAVIVLYHYTLLRTGTIQLFCDHVMLCAASAKMIINFNITLKKEIQLTYLLLGHLQRKAVRYF